MSSKLELLLKFQTIFEQKNWTQMDGCDDKLDRFGELIDNLKPKEIGLVIELTHMYEWMSYNDYHNNLRYLLKKICCLLKNYYSISFLFINLDSMILLFPQIIPSVMKMYSRK